MNEINKIKKYIEKERRKKEIKYLEKNIKQKFNLKFSNENQIIELQNDYKLDEEFDSSSSLQEEEINKISSINIDQNKFKNPKNNEFNTLNDYIIFYNQLLELSQSLPYLIKIDSFSKEKKIDIFSY